MSDELTPAEMQALADDIMGSTRRTNATEDVIEAAAARAPEADEVRDYPPAGDAVELDELTPGASNGETYGMGRGPGYDA